MKKQDVVTPILLARKESARPLFYVDDHGNPDHWGSCTLLKVSERFFVVTAAHVLDAWINTCGYLPNGNVFYELRPRLMFSTPLPCTRNREDDKVDIGFVEIGVSDLPSNIRSLFIDLSDVAVVEHREEKRWFAVIGHPLTKTHTDYGKQHVKVKKPFTFTSIQSDQKVREKLDFPADAIVLHFQQSKVFSDDQVMMHAPKPKGISGGAIWELPVVDNRYLADNKEKLVGIVIEHRCNENALIGTSMKRVLFSLAFHYPDLRDMLTEWLAPVLKE